MFRVHIALLVLAGIISTAIATSAPLFCKCTCAKNSTLLQLPKTQTCTHCTHAYCQSQNLPICAATAEADILSACIQRDSRKDEIIVWGFILGTAGLLAWAAFQRFREARRSRSTLGAGGNAGLDARGSYSGFPRG